MWVVYSLLILVGVLLAAVLLVPVCIRLTYDGQLKANMRVLGVPFTLLPTEEKADKPSRTGKRPKAPTPKKPSRLEELKELLRQDDLQGTLSFLQRVAGVAAKAAVRVCRAVTVSRLRLELCVATGDPADTAVRYGQVCGVLYPALALLGQAISIRRQHLRVEPNFLLERSDVRFDVGLRVSVVGLLAAGVPALWAFLTELVLRKETDSKEDM